MIKMIAGIYGYKNKNGQVEAKTVKSAPFSCTAEEEARLVGLRVAVYVNNEDGQDDGAGNDEGGEKPIAEMTKKELEALAGTLGVTLPKKATNKQIIELIEAAKAEHEGSDGDGDGDTDGDEGDEEAPNPGAAMPE